MSATCLILPIKRFQDAKQRLGESYSALQRSSLMEQMARNAITTVSDPQLELSVLVISSEPKLAECAAEHGVEIIDDHGTDSHSSAALRGIEIATGRGVETVLLLAADCPLLSSSAINAALAHHRSFNQPHLTILPDYPGTGTNGLIITPPTAVEPSFGPGSAQRHTELAANAGATSSRFEAPEFAHDVDTAADIQRLLELSDAAAKTFRALELKEAECS